MDCFRISLMLMAMGTLAACGGGGSTTASLTSDPPTTDPTDPTVDPSTAVSTLNATVADEGLTVRSSQNLTGGNVSLSIGQDFGIRIATSDGTTLTFEERNRTYYQIFGGYEAADETDLTVIALPGNDPSSLVYATYGYWAESNDPGLIDGDTAPLQGGSFFGGNNTPIGNMPTTGTANYSGFAIGNESKSIGTEFGGGAGLVVGTSEFTANFGTSSISGSIVLETAANDPFGTITLPSTPISANVFDADVNTDIADYTGSLRGQFFGPGAEELAGIADLTSVDSENRQSRLSIAFGAKQ